MRFDSEQTREARAEVLQPALVELQRGGFPAAELDAAMEQLLNAALVDLSNGWLTVRAQRGARRKDAVRIKTNAPHLHRCALETCWHKAALALFVRAEQLA